MSYPILMCEGVPFTVLPWNGWVWCTGSEVYLFVRREMNGLRTILYIGEAENLAERLRGHEKWDRALALGMNEVHAHSLAKTKSERLAIETYLRRRFITPLNEQSSQAPGFRGFVPFGIELPAWTTGGPMAFERQRNALADLLLRTPDII